MSNQKCWIILSFLEKIDLKSWHTFLGIFIRHNAFNHLTYEIGLHYWYALALRLFHNFSWSLHLYEGMKNRTRNKGRSSVTDRPKLVSDHHSHIDRFSDHIKQFQLRYSFYIFSNNTFTSSFLSINPIHPTSLAAAFGLGLY